MMDEPSSTDDFRADLRAALNLREMSFANRFDHEYRRTGRIIYALDSTVLHQVFTRPQKVKKPEETVRPDPPQTFVGPSNEPDLQALLRARQTVLHSVMYWTLLDRREASDAFGAPYLLLPGHDIEARRLYDSVARGFGQQPRHVREIDQLAQRILVEIERPHASEEQTRVAFNELFGRIYDVKEPHRLMARFNALLRERRLIRLPNAGAAASLPELHTPQGSVFDLWAEVEHEIEDDTIEGSVSWWANRLHGRLPSVYREIDQLALSTLDRLNRKLDPAGCRIVLVTNNEQILRSGRHYKPYAGERADLFGSLSFADLYLRDPRSLLVAPEFMRPRTEGLETFDSSDDVEGWLDTLLAGVRIEPFNAFNAAEAGNRLQAAADQWRQFRRKRARLTRALSEDALLESALHRKPDLHRRFVDQWSDYIGKLAADHAAANPMAVGAIEAAIEEARHDPESVRRVMSAFKEDLRRLTEESWTDFFSTAAVAGLELIDIAGGGQTRPVWPTPPLFLTGESSGQKAVEALWDPETLRTNPGKVLSLVSALESHPTPPNLYVHTLCYGLMFAMAGRWSLTKLLAQRAVEIFRGIERFHETGAFGADAVTGREAQYLLAVATRVTARSVDDDADALKALDEAQSSDPDPADRDAGGPARTGLRVEAERIAIEIGRVMRRSGLGNRITEGLLERLRRRALEVLRRAGDCEQPHIRRKVRVALRSEYFFTLMALGGADVRAEESKRQIVEEMVSDQIDDLEVLYGAPGWFPVRDARLLTLAGAWLRDASRIPQAIRSELDPERGQNLRRPINYSEWPELLQVDRMIAALEIS